MKGKHINQIDHYRNFFFTVLCIILFSLSLLIIVQFLPISVSSDGKNDPRVSLKNLNRLPQVVIKENAPVGSLRNEKCSHYDCLNIYRCGHRDRYKIQVYVYPLKEYLDEKGNPITNQISAEYLKVLKAIINSDYYSPNPQQACILVPSIDTLNQNHLKLKQISQALASLP